MDSSREINRTNSSLDSALSPFRENMKTMFDLNSNLNTDLNEFNAFFNKTESKFAQIERPQNPFHKNFESYKTDSRKHAYSQSVTDANTSELLPFIENAIRKNPSSEKMVKGSLLEVKG